MISTLLNQPHCFSYEQVVRLLRWQGIDKPLTQPHLSLGFPAVDVVDLRFESSHQVLITTTLLGLYGASSPLPTFYTEELLEEAAEDGCVTRDFYNLINQPLYHLYYQAWNKYQLMLRWVEQRDPFLIECLTGLVGLSHLSSFATWGAEQLPYMGLFNILSRSALGLETLLSQAIGCPVTLEPFVACWVSIPQEQRFLLGEQAISIGQESYLGEQILDRANGCCLYVSVQDPATLNELLPQKPRYLTLLRLLRCYLLDPLEVQLRLWLAPAVISPVVLDIYSGQLLGINCCLGVRNSSLSPWMTQLPLGVD